MLEMHIIWYLKSELDNANIGFTIKCNAKFLIIKPFENTISKYQTKFSSPIFKACSLEMAKRNFISALDRFDESTPFKQIDDALLRLKVMITITETKKV